MNPDVDVRPPLERDERSRSRIAIGVVCALLAMGAAAVMNGSVFERPAKVDHLSIDNTGDHDIAVTLGPAGSELPLGVATQHCVRSFTLVLDQGDAWHLRFTSQGRDAGALDVSRTELEDSSWVVRIPDSVHSTLQARSVPVAPVRDCPSPQ